MYVFTFAFFLNKSTVLRTYICPSCIVDCGALGNPFGGTADSSAGTTYGSVATFTCDLGYTMTGTATSTCQADESWDNLDPGCQINGTVKPV